VHACVHVWRLYACVFVLDVRRQCQAKLNACVCMGKYVCAYVCVCVLCEREKKKKVSSVCACVSV